MSDSRRVGEGLDEHIALAQECKTLAEPISRVASVLIEALGRGNKLLLCGNGGSAADAQHLAAEFEGRFLKDRVPLPALALNVNCSALTAIGNDYGYERVFVRAVEAHGRVGDVFIGLSTSGNSENVLIAAARARELGLTVIGLTGRHGGRMAGLCDICIAVPSLSTPRIQEMHITLGHILCGLVEDALC